MAKKKDIISSIKRFKNKKNAVILAHNFQLKEVHDIADFIGDSIEMCRQAKDSSANILLVCGARFMAEMVKISSPKKRVLLANRRIRCPLAESINVKRLKALQKRHPMAITVSFIASPAKVKAESDLCVSASSAIDDIKKIDDEKEIIFIPDKYLADYVKKKTKRKIIPYTGYCPMHVSICAKNIIAMKKDNLDADILIHPQCTPDLIELADKVLSSSMMAENISKSDKNNFIVASDSEFIELIKKKNPKKTILAASNVAECKALKRVGLRRILDTLRFESNKIKLSSDTIKKASSALEGLRI